MEVLVQNLPDKYRLMALLAAWCAMRFGELAELRRGDIDLKHKRIEIRRAVVRVRGEMIVGPPKTDAGIRDVSIPPHLMPAVEDHLDRLVGPSADALVFPSSSHTNRHMQPSTLYKVYYPAREAARSEGPPLARPPPHGRSSRCPDRCHARRADGSPWTHDPRRRDALSARRRRPGRRDRPAPV
nr:tyrosine-type recombinase/integrase [Nocardioides lijunqiniae]